ncbi:vWA domain-containing protein [Nakamurella sp.]|uniref:vWA domain-containing protein n=1 Tax=Nakamurella sp. TaxID=1869182 RepID=UPI003B3AD19B
MGAGFAGRLAANGVPVPVHRAVWWTRAVTAGAPATVPELYWLSRVTLVDRPDHLAVFDTVFAEVFGTHAPVPTVPPEPDAPATHLAGPPGAPPAPPDEPDEPDRTGDGASRPAGPTTVGDRAGEPEDEPDGSPPAPAAVASEIELLLGKDFAECDPDELAELNRIVDRMRLVAPTRPARWQPTLGPGRSLDLRRTLRRAARSGGDPVRWVRRRRRALPRRVVLLADVSGSMQAYARVYLRVLQGAVLGARAHAYVFATRLHPVTRSLARGPRETGLTRAMSASPDASGGTRIGASVKEFLDTGGRRGMARGAVVVIVSDGWERADPVLLGEQMARLRRLAHRVIWVNPRKAAPGFAPLAGGMAAALPHVDAFIEGHSAQAVQGLIDAIADGNSPRRRAR